MMETSNVMSSSSPESHILGEPSDDCSICDHEERTPRQIGIAELSYQFFPHPHTSSLCTPFPHTYIFLTHTHTHTHSMHTPSPIILHIHPPHTPTHITHCVTHTPPPTPHTHHIQTFVPFSLVGKWLVSSSRLSFDEGNTSGSLCWSTWAGTSVLSLVVS